VISPDDFRNVLSHFASGVTIVTTCDADQRPTGLTASAFSSVSLDPPLVLICVDHKSNSFPHLQGSGKFAINILHREHENLSRRFASSKIDNKFDGVEFRLGALGLPLIDEALASLECRTVNAHVEGDHTIFVGRVESITVGTGEPLVYYRGRYHRLRGDDA
jgi:flavin reductase (DIM6/NTAB) family NADH-FMN oxidoreductase RutF